MILIFSITTQTAHMSKVSSDTKNNPLIVTSYKIKKQIKYFQLIMAQGIFPFRKKKRILLCSSSQIRLTSPPHVNVTPEELGGMPLVHGIFTLPTFSQTQFPTNPTAATTKAMTPPQIR